MLKRFGGTKLDSGIFDEEDVNPTSYIPNLADAMLVLAVGCMLALVINWNIHVGGTTGVQADKTVLTEVKDYDSLTNKDLSNEVNKDGLEEKGTVYVDPNTGKMYVVVKEK